MEDLFAGRLAGLQNTAVSIQTLSQWMLFHHKDMRTIVQVWEREFRIADSDIHMPMLYLANDVMQTSRKKHGNKIVSEFSDALIQSMSLVGDEPQKKFQALKLIRVWKDRAIFGFTIAQQMQDAVNGVVVASPTPAPPAASPRAPLPAPALGLIQSPRGRERPPEVPEKFKPVEEAFDRVKTCAVATDLTSEELNKLQKLMEPMQRVIDSFEDSTFSDEFIDKFPVKLLEFDGERALSDIAQWRKSYVSDLEARTHLVGTLSTLKKEQDDFVAASGNGGRRHYHTYCSTPVLLSLCCCCTYPCCEQARWKRNSKTSLSRRAS
jgi:hypothetical protein